MSFPVAKRMGQGNTDAEKYRQSKRDESEGMKNDNAFDLSLSVDENRERGSI